MKQFIVTTCFALALAACGEADNRTAAQIEHDDAIEAAHEARNDYARYLDTCGVQGWDQATNSCQASLDSPVAIPECTEMVKSGGLNSARCVDKFPEFKVLADKMIADNAKQKKDETALKKASDEINSKNAP